MSDKDKPKDQDKIPIARIGVDYASPLPPSQRMVPLSAQPDVKAISKKIDPKGE